MEKKETISARQETVAAMLAAGRSVASVCRECGVAQVTVWRWKKLPEFNQRVEELRQQLIDGAIGRLAHLMSAKALDILEQRLDKVDAETGQTAASLDDVRACFDLYAGVKSNVELEAKLDKILEQLEGGSQ